MITFVLIALPAVQQYHAYTAAFPLFCCRYGRCYINYHGKVVFGDVVLSSRTHTPTHRRLRMVMQFSTLKQMASSVVTNQVQCTAVVLLFVATAAA